MTMKWRANADSLQPRCYEIKHDPSAGYFLYVFENGKCVRDELQDSLEGAVHLRWNTTTYPKTLG